MPQISILVDYAHEPQSLKLLLETFEKWRENLFFDSIIHILSCDGAGRDDWKKPIMGEISYQKADYTFITTDNYNFKDNPELIMDLLTQKYPSSTLNTKYFRNSKRLDSLKSALSLAKTLPVSKVLICSTGVGSEQGLTQPGGRMDWDERQVWKNLWSENNLLPDLVAKKG